ncbi:hypothetical protein DB35_15835 [Streptomyces abyssalis]|uniref:PIN domain-containing protein n=1 Tax=Streptomyces abyssalis TaxID=933944 RepID=A0A1E7JFS5_9ACTN|nr:hypothetical protein AN215_22185 [Streptomyces abyssalis]OEU91525.1 hypothetical protein DB35_15835 [Streptomyces abyssalis]
MRYIRPAGTASASAPRAPGQARTRRAELATVTVTTVEQAQMVRAHHGSLDLDLTDAVNVVLARDYDTDAILTLDLRDFRAITPLGPHKAFRLLPDDL